MRSRNALVAATLSTLGMIVWLACEDPGESAAAADFEDSDESPLLDESSGGSGLPCAVPLAWRVARVDSEFGLGMTEAGEALRKAIGEWEQATGRTLFALDAAEGSPIRLVYDERQARSSERARLEAEMREIAEDLDRRREQLSRQNEAASTSFLQHEQLSVELQRRVAAHNDLVRRWNDRGGAPLDVLRRVRVDGQALEQEDQERSARAQQLEEMRGQIEADRTRLQEDVAEHNRRVAEIEARFPPSRIESGVYREAIRLANGRPVSASREIRVYRFSDPEDLVRVVAHELGHALGLGHVDAAGALMSEEYGPRDAPQRRRIQREDVDALVALCPGLFEG